MKLSSSDGRNMIAARAAQVSASSQNQMEDKVLLALIALNQLESHILCPQWLLQYDVPYTLSLP